MAYPPSSKIHQYEDFLNEVLRNNLKGCLKVRSTYKSEIEEYVKLKKALEQLSQVPTTPLKAQVDLGCGFFAQAEISETEKLLVSVGFGFFLSLTHTEALAFIDKKIGLLNQRVEVLEKEASQINTDIKLVLSSLSKLQGLPEEMEDL